MVVKFEIPAKETSYDDWRYTSGKCTELYKVKFLEILKELLTAWRLFVICIRSHFLYPNYTQGFWTFWKSSHILSDSKLYNVVRESWQRNMEENRDLTAKNGDKDLPLKLVWSEGSMAQDAYTMWPFSKTFL
jgi:hypothetical protein